MSLYGTQPTGGPGDGVFPPSIDHITCCNKGGTARVAGNLMALDMATATATSIFPGGTGGVSIWNTLKDIAAGQSAFGYYCGILEENIANNGFGKVTFYGIVVASVTAGAVKGDLLTVDTANFSLKKAAAATDRVVGVQLDTIASGKATVLFDGLTLGGPVV